MRVLVACEESQAVCKAFRERGHEAYSCDIQECSGGHPEWHIQADVLQLLKLKWDMMIAFPPCTDLAASGAPSWPIKQADGRQQKAVEFVKKIYNSPINKVCIENPVGILNTAWRKPDQIVHPYFWGDEFMKKTCLWLKGLPRLLYVIDDTLFEQKTIVEPKYHYTSNSYHGGLRKDGTRKRMELPVYKAWDDSKQRSKTFTGIARAMAEQWG